jgi:hypothetical protein
LSDPQKSAMSAGKGASIERRAPVIG